MLLVVDRGCEMVGLEMCRAKEPGGGVCCLDGQNHGVRRNWGSTACD